METVLFVAVGLVLLLVGLDGLCRRRGLLADLFAAMNELLSKRESDDVVADYSRFIALTFVLFGIFFIAYSVF